jgi:hypothetical protein
MNCYVILHSKLVVDEGDGTSTHHFVKSGVQVLREQDAAHVVNLLDMRRQLQDQQARMQLLNDLVEHMCIHIKKSLSFMTELCP